MSDWVPKGWGGEKWLVNNDLYCGKVLFFVKGKRCSFHYHKSKTETFIVQEGKILLLYSDNTHEIELKSDEVVRSIAGAERLKLQPSGFFYFSPIISYIVLDKDDVFDIPVGRVHQIIALEESKILEVSTHHEDSDSFRVIKGD